MDNGRRAGDILVGSIVDLAGVARAKVVPASRLRAFVDSGMGASPSWHVFTVDNQIAFTENFSVIGDYRLRIAEADVRPLSDSVFWAPARVYEQHGEVAQVCTRTALLRTVDRLADAGLEAAVGHEIEFTLFPDDDRPNAWAAYGLGAALDTAPLFATLLTSAERASLPIEQLHAEYGEGQFELALPPEDPVRAADNVVLARILISRAARAHGMRVSFSPVPRVSGAGNGAHVHFSLSQSGKPLLGGGEEVHGLTSAGAQAIAGVLHHLPDVMAVLAGSVISPLRLTPGSWSGAHCCWGLENREAAVRLCSVRDRPTSANVEVKVVDPSANPYVSSAVILSAALDGIRSNLPLVDPVDVNPADQLTLDSAHSSVPHLPTQLPEMLERLERSTFARVALSSAIIEALTAVRRREYQSGLDIEPDTRVEHLRFAWSLHL